MEFYPDLYIGEKVEKPGVLLKKIKKQKKIPDAYIIALPRVQMTSWISETQRT